MTNCCELLLFVWDNPALFIPPALLTLHRSQDPGVARQLQPCRAGTGGGCTDGQELLNAGPAPSSDTEYPESCTKPIA